MLESDPVHVSVMPEEIIRFFQQIPEKENLFFLDGTAGEGGHSKLILETFPNSKLIFMDRDETMLKRAETRLDSFGSRATPHHSNFSEFTSDTLFKLGNVSSVDGIVLDLGISTYHFTNSEKGFSYAKEEPLDMRLDFSCKKTASEILKYYSEKELNRVFWEYGEERWSKKIASVLVERRKKESLQTSKELADLIAAIIPRKFWPPKTHPATRIFQALRIEVNSELLHIEKGLRQLAALLN
ncbi:MAG: 16S rRNA (cytosine(1402)-N(4))-methyltransferase RsmH, partial [Leptospiraceae bacterium]|nr:16S rRNA (cytosine(1402)-N(4))-methyltransferase RsmH [Leptospiraceae bacterium]